MKRQLMCSLLSRSGLVNAVLQLRSRGWSEWLTVLTYHRAGPPPSFEGLDPNVVSASAEAFEAQVAFCRQHFNVIGIDELHAFQRGAPLPPLPLLITLDDGYRDNVDVVYPILRRHAVKATFFIATAYVDERRLFWWDRIHFVVGASAKERLELDYPYPMTLALGPEARARARATARALRVVKESFRLDLPRYLEHLAERAGVELGGERERALVDEHLMTWDDVRALRRGGMDVQSHTHEHRVVQTLSREELVDDLLRARLKLEDVLNEPVRALAYPVGKAQTYDDGVRHAVRAAGYELGFSNRSGVNPLARLDPLDVRRIPIDESFSADYFTSVLAVPRLAYPPKKVA